MRDASRSGNNLEVSRTNDAAFTTGLSKILLKNFASMQLEESENPLHLSKQKVMDLWIPSKKPGLPLCDFFQECLAAFSQSTSIPMNCRDDCEHHILKLKLRPPSTRRLVAIGSCCDRSQPQVIGLYRTHWSTSTFSCAAASSQTNLPSLHMPHLRTETMLKWRLSG